MTEELMKLLQSVDTPTVCNAIEVAEGRRGFDDYTRGTLLCSAHDEPAMVGYARTARIAAVQAPSDPPEEIRQRRMDYYRYMSEGPRPAVVVIEDTDYPNCVGAFWGEINTTVHRGFGLGGALTNGVMRDLGDVPSGFPVVAGSIGPSHAFVHVREIDCTVNVAGLSVSPGALVHADRHGAVVIPETVVPTLTMAIRQLLETEKLILEPARGRDFDFATFEKAWNAFEKART